MNDNVCDCDRAALLGHTSGFGWFYSHALKAVKSF